MAINELYHHGIKGQKWGVRRYQNSDGSLTAAGKRRYLKTLNEAKKLGETTAELERRTRFYNEGRKEGQKILTSTDEVKEYEKLFEDFTKRTQVLGKRYEEVITDVKTMNDGYDYIQTLIRDDKLNGYVEYMAMVGKSRK